MRLEPDPFLTELTRMFERHKAKGTVRVTMKRSNLRKKPKAGAGSGGAAEGEEEAAGEGYVCVVRASDGKKKISAHLGPREHARFQAAYGLILKAHMDALKRRDKAARRKGKAQGGAAGGGASAGAAV
eukprot:TRINITY_DN17687_c0_g4_i1.p1 TRINITY_DN17687_c0_g4~~TRINITY_DN17687_c0_g4_i1.p1  ORF type:complete len:128 (-),score=2.89 TRINITY_DN17687_c0_g4_i1:169-552(-)